MMSLYILIIFIFSIILGVTITSRLYKEYHGPNALKIASHVYKNFRTNKCVKFGIELL